MKTIAMLLAVAVLANAGAEPAVPASAPAPLTAKTHPLRNVNPRDAYIYFSGNGVASHNLPAMYAYQGDIQKLVVVGRGYREEFPISHTEEAFAAYRELLKKTHYRIDDPNNGRSPLAPPK